jgi:predicted transcriptional regulator
MATTARQRNSHPMSYYREMVKHMDNSQKLELITILAESIRPAIKLEEDEKEDYILRPFTIEELNARIDEAEADIAAGRVIDDDEVWAELEEELVCEEQREMAEVL